MENNNLSLKQISEGLNQAQSTLLTYEAAIKEQKNQLARLLIGRLKGISPCILASLKKELNSFNSKTHTWK